MGTWKCTIFFSLLLSVIEIFYIKKFIKIFIVSDLYNRLSYKSVTDELETVFNHSSSAVKQLIL